MTLFFGLGSAVFTYTQIFFSEILSAALMAGAYYFLLKDRLGGGWKNLAFSGLLAGLLPLTKPTLIVASIVFLAYIIYKRGLMVSLVFTSGFLLTLSIFMAYNTVLFGSPIKTGYNSEVSIRDWGETVVDLTGMGFWSNNPLKTVPLLTLILLFTQPIIMPSFYSMLKNKQDYVGLIMVLYLVLAVTYGFRTDSIGGLCWSWRYMTPLVPLFAIPTALIYEEKTIPYTIFWIIFYVSLVFTIASLIPAVSHIQTTSMIVKLVQKGAY
jgi:uncharacterized MAPEG superfamily protein